MSIYLYKKTLIVATLASALALSACATDPTKTGSIKRGGKTIEQMNVAELNDTIGYLSQRYEKKPKDKKNGLTYANSLRIAGRDDQALAVMQQLVIAHPEDDQILAAYGKALASNGDLLRALEVIKRAQKPDNPDWKLLSAEGAILDQLERPAEARAFYNKALTIKPGESSILSNLGMSYLLEGELQQSEKYLRQAIGRPGADSRTRQNLALVIGLQGRFQEAEKMAAGELNQSEAQANINYLRQMLKQQNAWTDLKQEDKKS
ncbi:MAG: tetratricopeptide repeat protein [Nitratireductor sp.]